MKAIVAQQEKGMSGCPWLMPASVGKRVLAAAQERFRSLFQESDDRSVIRVCREMLALHEAVAGTRPGIGRRERYRRTVMARTGATPAEAEEVLERAEESFACWPVSRPLTFCDVVHYVAVMERFGNGSGSSTRIAIGRVVADHVPNDL